MADALSRCEGHNDQILSLQINLLAFSQLIPQWVLDKAKLSWRFLNFSTNG
jgi:hypothetical protein